MDTQILLTFVLVCALSDLRTRRIPNTLILCGFFCALLSRFFVFPPGYAMMAHRNIASSALRHNLVLNLLDGCGGALLPWLFLGPLAALRMIGGGDVKLFSVIGLQLGCRSILLILWSSLLLSALWSVVLVVRRRSLRVRLRYLYQYLGRLMISQKPLPYRSPGESNSGTFCLAPLVLTALLALSTGFCMDSAPL